MLCSIIWQVLQLEYSLTCFKSYFNKWKKLSIGIDFGIGIDQNSWYRYRYRYRPKKLVSPITMIRGIYFFPHAEAECGSLSFAQFNRGNLLQPVVTC